MSFNSILFKETEDIISTGSPDTEEPGFFVNLNLDQVINAVTAGKEEYDLKPFFYYPLKDADYIKYRQEIFQDLEKEMLLDNIRSFAQKMITIRQYRSMIEKLYYKCHKQGWFLESVIVYCDAVQSLLRDLTSAKLKSRGFRNLRKFLENYTGSEDFKSLLSETQSIKTRLSALNFSVIINENKVSVRKYEQETDYTPEIEKTFAKFREGAVKDYLCKISIQSGMNHIDAAILEFVAKLYPDVFLNLDNYCKNYHDFENETLKSFDREIQFYIAFLEYIAKIKRPNLKFCYPHIAVNDKEIYSHEGFDLALANKSAKGKSDVVCNDFYLKGRERVFVVSGPNQGGKTTFARAFGQMHYLASLGCPVPGKDARLFLFDKLFTHFETVEDIRDLRGKLLDDLARIHHILNQATSGSIIIMNEIFTSTTLQDAVFLSEKIMEEVIRLDLLCVWITFIDELSSFSDNTVSMISRVIPENPGFRTYKILRMPADGLAYALSIAVKHNLTYNSLKERLR